MKGLNEFISENSSVNETLYVSNEEDRKVFDAVIKAMDKKKPGEGPGFVRELLEALYHVTKTKTDSNVIKGAKDFLHAVEA